MLWNKAEHCICQGQLVGTVMDLHPHLENFSRSLCQEKDVMNHEFRTFVHAYATALTRRDYREFSIFSTLISPLGDHTLRIINHYALIP